MPLAAGQYIDRESKRISEIISVGQEHTMAKLDPVFDGIIRTAQGVGKFDMFGRDYKAIKTYSTGFAGVVETTWGTQAHQADAQLYGSSTTAYGNRLFTQAASTIFPAATEGAKNATFDLAIPLRGLTMNIGFSLEELQAEATDAFIGSVIGPRLKAFARHIGWIRAIQFFVNQAESYALGRFTVASATFDNMAKTVVFQPDNFATHRFHEGMRVDLFNDNGSGTAPNTTLQNDSSGRVPVFVSNVDGLTGKVTLQFLPSTSLQTDAVGGGIFNGDTYIWVVLANSYSATSPAWTMAAGLHSWMKGGDASGASTTNANTLLGTDSSVSGKTINVNLYSEFKSLVNSAVGTLTEGKLKQFLTRFHAAKMPLGRSIDTLIASDGVWLNYESQKVGMYVIDRTSRLSDLNKEGQNEGFTITHDGRTYKAHTSFLTSAGTLYGIKRGGNNWKQYCMPTPQGVKKGGQGIDVPGTPIEFVVPALTGNSSVKWPVTSNGALTTMMQMPCWARCQLIPDQPDGMILSGITEDRWYQT